ncbi:NAD(P)/FAD-dependent oxidoreductase [Streptomyces odontomachi]|uniref:NAD(P)/FAD-dependent oxidoreductase n=1 Tax=Streptomyces odontomachi TaxID=2944940 RepID=UPI002108D9EB|nr:FAD-dependent oxidoreductase [Streptomyces sp. ODS25]
MVGDERPVPEAAAGGTLIVGASQAGLQLAVSLRQLGDSSPITLVGEEPYAPYQRPPLSKEYLSGASDLTSVDFRAPGFYEESGIDLVVGERVTGVTLSGNGNGSMAGAGSGVALTASGRRLPFARLALTVGAAPRRLAVPGAELAGVCLLRDRDDAVRLRARLHDAARVVVVGGGFIGLEAAAAARGLGKEVTVVESAARLMGRAVAEVLSAFYLAAHRRRGTRVLLSTTVTAFTGDRDGRVTGVRLDDGTLLPADLVVVGVGAAPRTELARALGLVCEDGIVVDVDARTSNPAICAAGDCTTQPHPMTGEGRVRLESVQNAVAQAHTAAATLLGAPRQARPVPWFWSHQGDLKLQIAGLAIGHDDHVVRGDPDSERFCVLYYRGGTLLAADAVNSPADYMAVRTALTRGVAVPREAAADPGVPLKSVLTARPDAVLPT